MSQRPEDDPNPLITLFRACVVCITDESGRFRGTGFFVAPGRVVTCGHVVHGGMGLRVRWQDKAAPVAAVAAVPPLELVTDPESYPLPDLAVLDVGDASGWEHPCVALTQDPPALGGSPDGLYLAGYTIEHGPAPALTGATTEFESLITEDGHTFYKLKRGQLLPGFSGSPLLDLTAGLVAGIVESSRGRHSDLGGFAVSAAELAATFPDVLEANLTFHRDDNRWKDAAEAEKVRAREREGGRGRLPLRRPVVPLIPDEDLSPTTILRPRHAVVDYVGREQLLGELVSWCEREPDDGESTGLWFVTGGGGFGKTRLAVEACREAEARGWTAGLLSTDVTDAKLQALAEWPGRLLIAIDYAEARPDLIRRLAEEFSARAPRPPVRIMLLVRRRTSRADLLSLFNERQDDELDALLRQAAVSRLEDADSEVNRLDLFRQAVKDFTPFLGPPPSRLPSPRLRAHHFARPLYVLTAAYLARAATDTDVDVDALSEAGLLRKLLDEHEAGHWDRWNKRRQLALDPVDQRTAVAVATLLTAQGEDEALTVARLIPHFDAQPEPRLMAIARWLAELYPPPAGNGQILIAPLEPDRLGEVLAGDELKKHPDLLAAAIDAASDRQLTQALTVVGRAAREDEAMKDQLRIVLDDRLSNLFGRGFAAEDYELLNAVIAAMTLSRPVRGAATVADQFPEVLPVWLRPLAVAVTALAVDGLRDRDDPESLSGLARSLNNLAVHLGEIGQWQRALDTAREATTLYRQFVHDNANAHLPHLAASLGTLARSLNGVGQRQEALETAREAAIRYRQLADNNPGAYLPDLAVSLNNLGNALSDVGLRQEALEITREAAAHSRRLANDNPDAYLPYLAGSLNNLANRLSDVGQRQEALETAREATTRYRQLANNNPGAYLPDLAMSLNNLAGFLGTAGQQQEALEIAREAVTIRRQLADHNPDAYLPDLAMSLSNLANRLGDVGQQQQALETAREAATIRRQLANDNPDAYLPNLAVSLNNLAGFLRTAGQHQEALETAGEAATIRRQLADHNPDAHLPDLASSLNNLAGALSDVGQQQ
jgi:Trypsin-like peptidase domain/Tetratricopeptide repeat